MGIRRRRVAVEQHDIDAGPRRHLRDARAHCGTAVPVDALYTRLELAGQHVDPVDRLLTARRVRRLRHADLARLHVPLKKVLPFVEAADYRPGRALDAADLAAQLTPPPVQRSLF